MGHFPQALAYETRFVQQVAPLLQGLLLEDHAYGATR
jgi:hypothetical protein